MSGLPGAPPAGWGFSYLDHTAGYYGAAALLLALYERNRSGLGQYIDIAQIETGMVLAGPTFLDYSVNGRPYQRPGNPPGNQASFPLVAPHNAYRCRPDRSRAQPNDCWVTIAVFTDDEWDALCGVMGEPVWCKEERFGTNEQRVKHRDALDALIESWTIAFDRYDLMQRCQAAGVAAGAVQDMADKMERDPQLSARQFYPRIAHHELGEHRFEGVPIHASRSSWSLRRPAPRLGEDNDYVLRELLGLDDRDIRELEEEAVV
jgi:crotonobetainyl-CoA:carnitine CoA-transferase CaiB-like acyl-CoA transferase